MYFDTTPLKMKINPAPAVIRTQYLLHRPTILQIRNKEEKFIFLNMGGFKPASTCFKHHCSIYVPSAILFLNESLNILSYNTTETETFVIDHKEKSPCLSTSNFVIN